MCNFDPLKKAPNIISKQFKKNIEQLLNQKHKTSLNIKEHINIKASNGNNISFIEAIVGTKFEAHVFQFYVKNTNNTNAKEGINILMDYLDCILTIFFKEKNSWLPLDFTNIIFEGYNLLVRHNYRNFKVEEMANKFLDKTNNF